MQWRALFSAVKEITPQQVREYIQGRSGQEFQLVDVRQPGEYAGGHLAGALLLPLKDLPERAGELDPKQPTIVYCAVGGRSRAAAQLLQGLGFVEVYNMPGGIKAWEGRVASGPEDIDLELFTGEEEYRDGVALAYAMEEGLQRFYLGLAMRAEGEQERALFQRLAGFEEFHKSRLRAEFTRAHGPETLLPEGSAIMEGGSQVDALLHRVSALSLGPAAILDLAMALETQALDLYSRMARKSAKPESGALFLALADEEKGHLRQLAEELERLLGEPGPGGDEARE